MAVASASRSLPETQRRFTSQRAYSLGARASWPALERAHRVPECDPLPNQAFVAGEMFAGPANTLQGVTHAIRRAGADDSRLWPVQTRTIGILNDAGKYQPRTWFGRALRPR